jgi:hypothetical protein
VTQLGREADVTKLATRVDGAEHYATAASQVALASMQAAEKAEVHAPPAHDVLFRAVGTHLDNLGELGQLANRPPRLRAVRPAVEKPSGPEALEPMHPVAQSLPDIAVWSSLRGTVALACSRLAMEDEVSDQRLHGHFGWPGHGW